VNFGADGPNATPFQFVGGTSAALAALGFHSHGMLVDTATLSNGGHTLTASASTDGHNVFSLTVNNDGSWSFTSLGPIDHTLGDNTEAPGDAANCRAWCRRSTLTATIRRLPTT